MRLKIPHLKVAQKLMLMSIFFLLPDTLMLRIMLGDISDNIQVARLETHGIEYLRPLVNLLHLIPEHRRLSRAVAGGAAGESGELEKITGEIDRQLQDLEKTDRRYGEELSFTDEALAQRGRSEARPKFLMTDWAQLGAPESHLDADSGDAIYQHLLSNVRVMIVHAGDMSNLILDPDLDSYYLMDATLLSLPQAQDQLTRAIDDGEESLKNPSDRIPALANLHAQILRDSALSHVSNCINTALKEDGNYHGVDPQFQSEMPPALAEYVKSIKPFVELTEQLGRAQVGGQVGDLVTVSAYRDRGTAARDAGMALWNVTSRDLNRLLLRRIGSFEHHRMICLSITGMAVMAASLMVIFINRSINRPLKKQADALLASNAALAAEVRQRKDAQAQLLDASRRAGMAEIATGVLHNVGNVLNSVSTSATVVREKLQESKLPILGKAALMIQEHRQDQHFLTEDPKGRQFPDLLSCLVDVMSKDQDMLCGELTHLSQNLDHIKHILGAQQAMAKTTVVCEEIDLAETIENAVRLSGFEGAARDIEIIREFSDCPQAMLDRHKLLQILVNLITNAKIAVLAIQSTQRRVALSLETVADGELPRARITVTDTGVGITSENLAKIFQHGFTTRKDGHGFGLHTAAIDVRHMGGSIKVTSPGAGRGAAFSIELPLYPAPVLKDGTL